MLLWKVFSGVHLKVFALSTIRAKRTGVEKDKRGYKEFICAAETNEVKWKKYLPRRIFSTITYGKINSELRG
jgi:hypothetical protein